MAFVNVVYSIRHDTIVHVLVGKDKEIFYIHKNLLCGSSDVFTAAFRPGSFKEGATGSIDLPDEDPNVFASFVEWLYMRAFSTSCKGSSESCPSDFILLTKLYILADKYLIPALKIDVLHEFKKHRSHSSMTIKVCIYIHKNTNPMAPLRLYVIDEMNRSPALTKALKDAKDDFVSYPELLIDIITRMADRLPHRDLGNSDGSDAYFRQLVTMEQTQINK